MHISEKLISNSLVVGLWKDEAHLLYEDSRISTPLLEENKQDAEEDVEVSRIHGLMVAYTVW